MTFLNNNNTNARTVLPDFQYLTSPSDEQSLSTTIINHIPVYPIPKSIDVNQYGNNITNNANFHSNTTHVNRNNRILSLKKNYVYILVFKVTQSANAPMNHYMAQQPATPIGRIMTG